MAALPTASAAWPALIPTPSAVCPAAVPIGEVHVWDLVGAMSRVLRKREQRGVGQQHERKNQPGARGDGEPLKLLLDIGNDADVVHVLLHKPGRKLLVASSDGRGFVVKVEDALVEFSAHLRPEVQGHCPFTTRVYINIICQMHLFKLCNFPLTPFNAGWSG